MFIEVKSIRPFYRAYKKLKTKTKRVGYWKPASFKLNKDAWARLKSNSMDRRAKIFVIVDLRFRKDDGRVDLLFTEEQIDGFVFKSTAKDWVHISLPELMNNGLVLTYEHDQFSSVKSTTKEFKQQALTT